MEKIYLDREFNKFWKKIKKGENFAFMRNADGERAIMLGVAVAAQEGNWKSPNYVTQLGKDIYSSLMMDEPNVYYALSCPCCDNEAYYWYLSRVKTKNVTFANLWINSNYRRFKKEFPSLKRDAILIANYRAKNHKIGNLNILKHYEIDDDCISFWENQAPQMIEQIKKDYGSRNDLLYVVSAGPMSGPIIERLYKNNPNNCYVDFGSSIDIYYREKISRPYMIPGNIYAERNCWMPNPYSIDLSVSVILNLYKRPEYLEKQLESIEKQSLKPKEILLYQDGTGDSVKISEDLKKRFNFIEISPENKGVWERFNFARKNAKSKYVCIFDDDTIPASRWLENCMTEMLNKEGLYGAIGIVSKNNKYESNSYQRFGWSNNNEKTTRVDFVGHSWFLKKDWLNYLFEGTEELQKYKICGEDMTLSYKLQQHKIKTYVPKQPKSVPEFLGSINGEEYGSDENSLFINNGWAKMTEVFDKLVNVYGFKTIKKFDKKYYKSLVYPSSEAFKLFYREKHGNKRIIHIAGIKISYYKEFKSKVLIVEPHPYHQEVLPSFVKYFNDLGYGVDVLVRKECSKTNIFCRIKHKPNIKYYDLSNIKNILKDCSKYEYVFFSSLEFEGDTFHGKYIDFLEFEPNAKKGILGCHHTLTNIGDYNSIELFNQGRVFSCSGFSYNERTVPMLAPVYYGKVKREHKLNRQKEFIVVGTITNYSKNHNLLFDTVEKLLKQDIKNFNITVIGKGKLKIPHHLRKNISFKGSLSFDKMFKCMEKADFYLPLVDERLENHIRYLNNCCTGSRNLILGFNKPCLINETFGKVYEFSNNNSILYKDNDLYEAMKEAILMDDKRYKVLICGLNSLYETIYKKSLANLKEAIEGTKK